MSFSPFNPSVRLSAPYRGETDGVAYFPDDCFSAPFSPPDLINGARLS